MDSGSLLIAAADGGVRGTIESVANTHDQIILALIAIIGTSIAALVYTIRNNGLGQSIAKDAREVNAAVNHIGPNDLRLYDVIARIEAKQDEFDRKWGNLPAEMGDAVGLVELIHGMDKRIAIIQAQLVEHVAWEMSVKYPKEG